ncbi:MULTISPECIES: ABC transporter substrate-binding protein [unclassified Sporosarcina]|uniref:ABC transporter substrate-binding protein n=1 Tax=unclassified Sporosarcina TaxID=2647733 RepID=UPI0020426D1E|nr:MULTISPECIES: ABC transporter substrate-binding protein [unclassified Sporosarcina]GKV65975.1 heme ABC transporter substrate-binding protein IsdE [Sporosarcina sp. NCCP-2331]GLB56025.1 heme ABC transporter substrate-binding protein IsdE [Sporosarcina sp. NCCP-2378]
MKKVWVGILVGVLSVMTACSSDTEESAPDKVAKETVAEAEVKGEEQLTAEEGDGVDEKELEELIAQFPETVPERLITTSVPLAEMLQLLDVTPVGVPTSTNPLPAEFDSVERIGSPMQPDLEVVTNLRPDVILGAESLRTTLDKAIEGMDLPAAYLPTDSFEDLKLSFKALGTYFGKEDKMNTVLDQLTAKEHELVKQGEGKELPSVMLMIGTSDSFMVMNDKSYVGSLIERLGAENIATTVLKAKETYSPINMEEVVVADPDIILVLASGDHGASEDMFKKEVEKNETWKQLSAYKNDNVHILDYEVFGVTSIKNAEKALTEISTYFYE